jgi:hypothetical protein
MCKESGEELVITFGYDNFLYCGLEITNDEVYRAMVELAKLESTCRRAKSRERAHLTPALTLPFAERCGVAQCSRNGDWGPPPALPVN